jgi:cell division transport system ATP-binding protein
MIICDQVSKQYPNGVMALNKVSFKVKKGEWVFLTGHSGAGKSTLFKLLAGSEKISSGHLTVGNTRVDQWKKEDLPFYRRKMGLIFQNPLLLPELTLFDNVALPLVIQNLPKKERIRRIETTLTKVGLLAHAHRYPYQLSAGEQQRASIARAIVHRPPLLLADEPTGNLDPALAKEIMQLFEQFLKIGVTVLIVSHDETLIQSLPYRVLRLQSGTIVQDTTPAREAPQPYTEDFYA